MLVEMFANYICQTNKFIALYAYQLRKETPKERNGHRPKETLHKIAGKNGQSVTTPNIYLLNTCYVSGTVLGLCLMALTI